MVEEMMNVESERNKDVLDYVRDLKENGLLDGDKIEGIRTKVAGYIVVNTETKKVTQDGATFNKAKEAVTFFEQVLEELNKE